MRGDRRTGPDTRVEVVTTGLLVRRLQRDPELAGVHTVILDECHERHLDSDLALAFCVDVRANLRPDLRLLATSATADAGRLAAVLAPGGAPVVTADDALHPVDVVWAPPPRRSIRRTACGSTRACSTTSPRRYGGRCASATATCSCSCPAPARSARSPAGSRASTC